MSAPLTHQLNLVHKHLNSEFLAVKTRKVGKVIPIEKPGENRGGLTGVNLVREKGNPRMNCTLHGKMSVIATSICKEEEQ